MSARQGIVVEGTRRLTRGIHQQFDGVGGPILPLERRRTRMDRRVPPDGPLVPLTGVGREESTHRRETISRSTFPAMKAMFAGRSANRRIR